MTDPKPVALITGAAHRLGRAIALALGQRGYRIMLHYNRSEQAAQETAASAADAGIDFELHQADLTDLAQLAEMFVHCERRFGRLDLLVNSAAIMQRGNFEAVTPDDWAATIDLNLRAPFFCTQHAARLMRRNPQGVIINISDVAAHQAWSRYPVHSISKAGVEMLTRVAAKSYGPGIRVNAIAPGPVLKPDRMSRSRWQEIGAELPLGQPGAPQDVIEALLFLVETDAIHGETLVVDGGSLLT